MIFYSGLVRAPPPPSEPAPPNQPTIHSGFRLPPFVITNNENGAAIGNKIKQIHQKVNGTSGSGAQLPKPLPRTKPQLPSLPKVRALYDYSPQDLDELELKEGEIIEVLKERE